MFELIPHTADVRARVTASSLDELFAESMRALSAAMHAEPAGGSVRHTIRVDDSADTTALLVDFLNEVLARAHVARELFTDARFVRLDGHSVEAELVGVAPASFGEDVKAVTYHEADVRRDGAEWTTMLVFDI